MNRWISVAKSRAVLWLSLLFFLCLLPILVVMSTPKPLADADAAQVSLEGLLEYFIDADGTLPFETVSQIDFYRSHFVRLPEFRSLGYGTGTYWFRVELGAEENWYSHRMLTIGSPELEELDVWVEHQDGRFEAHALGYHRSYKDRPITRLSALPLDTFPGMQIYFRVRTTNAVSVYADLMPENIFIGVESRTNFLNGLYFGILLIAVLLYVILGLRLQDVVMVTYAGYVASQLLFHLGATGYLPVLLAGQSDWLVDALPRIGWLGAAAFIALMWDRLLQLKSTYPKIHRLYMFTVALNLFLLFFALQPSLVTDTVLLIVKLANYLNVLNFMIAMYLLVQRWRQEHRIEWVIYLAAFVIPAFGALVNTITNQGFLPVNVVTISFYQVAALVHVFVMSYGLALRLRKLQDDKVVAEQEAAIVAQRAEQQRNFVAMLSHEFGNPLAAIDRSAQMVQINLPDMPEKEAQRLSLIRSNAAMLSDFVERFLMTEALDHGALLIARTPCRVRQVLVDAIRQQSEVVRPRIHLQECSEGVFELDTVLIGVAIGNLLTNALRYSPSESPVEVRAILSGSGLSICITDYGSGLDVNELDKLGAPYFRGAAAQAKKGSGLGYYFTRRIVEAHGGTLTARLGTNTGLTVEIFLPS